MLGRCQGRAACASDAGTTVNLFPGSMARDDQWWAEVDRTAVEPRGQMCWWLGCITMHWCPRWYHPCCAKLLQSHQALPLLL